MYSILKHKALWDVNECMQREGYEDMIMSGRVHTQIDRDDWSERVRPSRQTFSVDICNF